MHAATIVARIAVAELEARRVDAARQLLAGVLAMLDDDHGGGNRLVRAADDGNGNPE